MQKEFDTWQKKLLAGIAIVALNLVVLGLIIMVMTPQPCLDTISVDDLRPEWAALMRERLEPPPIMEAPPKPVQKPERVFIRPQAIMADSHQQQ